MSLNIVSREVSLNPEADGTTLRPTEVPAAVFVAAPRLPHAQASKWVGLRVAGMGNKLLLKPWVRFVGQVFVAVVGAMRVWPLFMHHLPLGPDLCPLPLALQEHVSSFCGFVG